MNQRINLPTIGNRVRVRIGNFSYDWMNRHPSRAIEGIVAENHTWQDPNSFRLCPLFTPGLSESVIAWDRVVSIENIDTSDVVTVQGSKPDSTRIAEVQTWPVQGSKGQSYTVTRNGSMWSCNCIAGGFGRTCKHVSKIKESIQD